MINNPPRIVADITSFHTGMTCEHCRNAVINEVSKVDGVQSVAVDLTAGVLTVDTSNSVDRSEIAAAVDEAGYTLQP